MLTPEQIQKYRIVPPNPSAPKSVAERIAALRNAAASKQEVQQHFASQPPERQKGLLQQFGDVGGGILQGASDFLYGNFGKVAGTPIVAGI